ncbi:hypothetical protein GXW78_07575 [Roseomonas terrae]|uniref:Uncharacterized protein n=1 Tax=Neoroseomonas terrae TaxID=424799 RepID=A0ABS5EER7_9PROT|nr:hypothetical protein [Neoroseomonas terrae]MBR0649514.1 hypothetical protein [Neoroseomonas terrae]
MSESRTWAVGAADQYGWQPGMQSLKAVALSEEYAAFSAAQVAFLLNAHREERPVAVSSRAALSILLKTGDWGRLKLFSRREPTADEQQNALIAAAIIAVDAVQHTDALGTDTEEDREVITTMMAGFAAAGLMRPATVERLTALMTAEFPVWVPAVTAENVTAARGLQDG